MNPGAFPQGTKPEDFRRRPHSEPINEIIANALFKGGVSEGWGRGILDIYELCKEAGLPEPEYDFVQNFVCLTIRFSTPLRPYVSGDVNGDVNGLSGSLKDVYLIVLKNPGIKVKRIAEIRGKSESTIWKQLTVLRKNGLIVYRGSDKNGGYYPEKS